MTTEQAYPAWTRDGTRPWHHRTHDREIGGRGGSGTCPHVNS